MSERENPNILKAQFAEPGDNKNTMTEEDHPVEQRLYTVFIGIGSNIQPEQNLPQAIELLRKFGTIDRVSSVWETPSVGFPGPNFLNAVIRFQTPLFMNILKDKVLCQIEDQLGRIRSEDKNAPRTIDLDILIYDGLVVDPKIWTQVFVAIPLAELVPGLIHPEQKTNLQEIAELLKRNIPLKLSQDLALSSDLPR